MIESIVLEEDLFSAALILPAAERAGYLHRACGNDQHLRIRVETLLADADAAAAFVDRQRWRPATSFAPLGEYADREFGPYRLLQSIGEGGCGEVFLAE